MKEHHKTKTGCAIQRVLGHSWLKCITEIFYYSSYMLNAPSVSSFFQNAFLVFSKKALYYIVTGKNRGQRSHCFPFIYKDASTFKCQSVQLAMSHSCANTAKPNKLCISRRGARACEPSGRKPTNTHAHTHTDPHAHRL